MALTKVKLIADGVINVDNLAASHGITTDNIGEGLSLYYTNERVGTYLTANNYATQSFVTTAVSNLVDAAPSTLDTLNELAAALGDDPNFATTVTNSIAGKLPLTGGTLTGNLTGTSATFSGSVGIKETSPLGDLHIKSQDTGVTSVSTEGSNLVLEGTENGMSILSSTAGAGYINFGDSDDNNVGMIVYGHSSNSMDFWTNAQKRMMIDSSGNVEIGATTKLTGYPTSFRTLSIQTPSGDNASILELVGNRDAGDGNQNGMIQFWNKTSTAVETARISGDQASATNSGILTFLTASSGVLNERMRIDSSGNVGIGSDNPLAKTHIKSGSSGFSGSLNTNYDNLAIEGNGNIGITFLTPNANNAGIAFSDEDADVQGSIVYRHSVDAMTFNTSATERMRITSSGNVGIGVTSPSVNLEIVGTGANVFSSIYSNFRNLNSKSAGQYKGVALGYDNNSNSGVIFPETYSSANSLLFYSYNGSWGERMRIHTDGNVGIGTTSPAKALTIGDGISGDYRIRVNHDDNEYTEYTGFGIEVQRTEGYIRPITDNSRTLFVGNSNRKWTEIQSWANEHNWYSGGSFKMRLTSSGNVGIGTTSPSSKLDIRGSGVLLSTISSNSTDGASVFYAINDSSKSGELGVWGSTRSAFGAISANNGYVFSNDDLAIGATLNVKFGTGVSNTERMRITSSGNVEIKSAGELRTYRSDNTRYGTLYTNNSAVYLASSVDPISIASPEYIKFETNGSEKMRITSSGYVYLGDGYSATNHRINLKVSQGNRILVVSGYNSVSNDSVIFYSASGANPSATETVLGVTTNNATGRSISAGGTINASGSDYAEYITKAVYDIISKGDIVGINNKAKLTNIFSDAVSFAVKSTNPSYVGGDTWFNNEKRPERTEEQTQEEFDIIMEEFESRLEIERAKVDRVAFSGQVPCNVYNAQVGDYIIPIETEDGKIAGQSVSNPTFEQYTKAVGKVWKIMEDGRAWISVKIG